MSAPWEKYQAASNGPWAKYASSAVAPETQQAQDKPEVPFGEIVSSAVKNLNPIPMLQGMTPENLSSHAPTIGAMGGEMLAGPPGAAIGAGAGQIVKRLADQAYGRTNLPVEPGPVLGMNNLFSPKEAIAPMIQSAVAGAPGTTEGKAVTKVFKKAYSKTAETLTGLKKDVTQTAFSKGLSSYAAPSLPKAQQIFGEALGSEGQAAMKETASEAFDPALSKARQIATAIGTKIENGEAISATEALQARQATDRVISATSWKDKMARNSLYEWRNKFDNELASQSGKLADASRTYRSAIVKDKLLTPTRMNKSGEPSAFLPMLLGAVGPVAGHQSGHTGKGVEAAAFGLAATSPMVWGGGAALMGAISPTIRQAVLSEFISRFVVGKTGSNQ